MNSFNSSVKYFIAALACIVLATGCLDSSNSGYSSTTNFLFLITSGEQDNGNPIAYDLDSTLVSGNDSIRITKLKFVYGDGAVGLNDTTASVFENQENWQQYNFPDNQLGYINPGLLIRGNGGTYDFFVFSIQKAPEDNDNIDSEFKNGSENYSMIIKGSYNGTDFTYRTEKTFKDTLLISPSIKVPENNVNYSIYISTDVRSWFKNGNGFYNPAIEENSTNIDNQIQNSFYLFTPSN